jgi:hypothetical protein
MYRVDLRQNSLFLEGGAKVKDGCQGSEPPARNSRSDEMKVHHVDVLRQFSVANR